jgi:hemoglobin-like flavoprotein
MEVVMTPEQITLVQESFKQVQPIAAQAADLFYGRLFEIAPQMRALFPEDLTEQKRKLMAMLGTAVAGLNRTGEIVPAVQALGRRHAGYKVTAEHYKPVGEALIWTLEQGLGDAFTPPVRTAWLEAYTLLASVMKEAAEATTRAKPGLFARMFGRQAAA